MRKIRISDLPLYNSLVGLFTLGTDKDNRSVKVSLEFIKDTTDEAAAAGKAALKAQQIAEAAAAVANVAAGKADAARLTAGTAAANANEAVDKAVTATTNANEAAAEAVRAAGKVQDAIEASEQATTSARQAAEAAWMACRMIPTAMEVEWIPRLTYGNKTLNQIKVKLQPETVLHNVIFISDNVAVRVDPAGRIKVVGVGVSEIHVIPTANTSLAKTIQINVTVPTIRFADKSRGLRITGSGDLRMK